MISATNPAGTSKTAGLGSPPWTEMPPAKKPPGIKTSAAVSAPLASGLFVAGTARTVSAYAT